MIRLNARRAIKIGVLIGGLALIVSILVPLSEMARRQGIGSSTARPNNYIPYFSLSDHRGVQVTSGDLAGSKYALLFFRADCSYCLEELKQLHELAPHYQGRFKLFPVSLSDEQTTGRLTSELGFAMECYMASPETLSRFKIGSVPLLLLIDEQGRILYLQIGTRSSAFQILIFDRFIRGESLTDEAIRSVYRPSDR